MDRFGLYGAPLNAPADTSCWEQKKIQNKKTTARSLLCMCASECVDSEDISVMDSVLIERRSGGVRGLITITELITSADAGSIRTCYSFQ